MDQQVQSFNVSFYKIASMELTDVKLVSKIASTKNKSNYLKESRETNLTNRFVSQKQKSNLSRAPPLN